MRKPLLLLLCILAFSIADAQKTEKYYDYRWKACAPREARFYSITTKTDSGWLRRDYYIREQKLQMTGLYKDDSCTIKNGGFAFYYPSGALQSAGRYTDQKKQGLWIQLRENQQLWDSTVYNYGQPIGTSLKWHSNGLLSDSAVYRPDGSGSLVSWFDNAHTAATGNYTAGTKQNGEWRYYHRNGQVSAVETYKNGRLVNKKYYTEEGVPVADTTAREKAASFPGGPEAWKQYLSGKLKFPREYKIENGDAAIVVVDFAVTENGDITDVATSSSFHPAFDRIAEDVIRRSPKWVPAFDRHNRNIKARRRQPLVFKQTKQ
ncbi:energy transducer TonB [Niabella aurantiaca]|uniref:energy transducer TonB n=1 Tax=Niabella aurantiaca TaxID=379900 RepID=UPI000376C682|nr:energy transducer TonB [Niabella aurantiaca]